MNTQTSINFKEMEYEEFWLERLSYKAKEQGTDTFTKEEVEWAIKQTDYKYFGDYEFSDQQKMAVDILVWAAQEYVK
ncbi:MAG: hypothetical protein Tp178MES00d2C33159851_141 [Prokaryotic dsDNA virus sp.]|nr:MAG: hypothetical protein Tp178MES00d2C33159851_141 [Prokaryotic dsDNA virus sp.]|tara:strand:+ start:11595 stop:11825 length:231 start_codon:yes stop_codon:yes gene_type:complete